VTTAEASFVRQPARGSSVLAVAVAVLAVTLVAGVGIQRRVLAVGVLGAAVFAAGVVAWRRGDALVGELAAGAGVVFLVVALVLAATRPMLTVHRFELIPGILGVWILAAAVAPVRLGWERRLISVGTGLILAAIAVGALVQTADLWPLLVAAALTILAWDAAENAVSLGAQVGADAPTRRAEVTHLAATGFVGGCAIVLVYALRQIDVTGLSFAALTALLLAGVVLAVGHYR
jgi:hypothetical protein